MLLPGGGAGVVCGVVCAGGSGARIESRLRQRRQTCASWLPSCNSRRSACPLPSLPLPPGHTTTPPQGYDIYQHTASIPGRDADPQPIIFAYISLNLQTLSQSGLIPASASHQQQQQQQQQRQQQQEAGSGGVAPASSAAAAQQVVAAVLSEQQKSELKARLKEVMARLMHRDQSAAAMQELYQLRK